MAHNALMDLEEQADRFKYLIRDRGPQFVASFDVDFAAAGIDVVKTAVQAPVMNAIQALESIRHKYRRPEVSALRAGVADCSARLTATSCWYLMSKHREATAGLGHEQAEAVANELIGLAVHPVLPRMLFGTAPLTEEMPDPSRLADEVDLRRIRQHLHRIMPPIAT